MNRRHTAGGFVRIAALATFLAASLGSAAAADDYPPRPVTVVVPFTPGSGPDIVGRALAAGLTTRMGQPFIVDNRVGASGTLGTDVVAKSAPNGLTLLVAAATFTITPSLYKKLPYDPYKDFTPIVKLAAGSMALVVNPAVLPVKTLDELVTYVKAHPGKVFYGSPGNGTPQHLAVELLKQRLGIDMTHVPYKGAAGANNDLLAGQIQLMVLPVHTSLPFVKAGRLRVLAVSGSKRSVLAPDLPTFDELGLKNLDIDLYFWLGGPAGMPPDIVQKLNRAATEILNSPQVQESLLAQGLEPSTGTPEAIAALLKSDLDRWKRFVAATGITAD